MRNRRGLQAKTMAQLELFGGGNFPPRAANDSDPFASAPRLTNDVFRGVLDNRGEEKVKLVSLGLSYRDAVARQGPPYAYTE